MRGEDRLVLAADDPRDLGREAPEDHALGVDDDTSRCSMSRGVAVNVFIDLTNSKWVLRLTGA